MRGNGGLVGGGLGANVLMTCAFFLRHNHKRLEKELNRDRERDERDERETREREQKAR